MTHEDPTGADQRVVVHHHHYHGAPPGHGEHAPQRGRPGFISGLVQNRRIYLVSSLGISGIGAVTMNLESAGIVGAVLLGVGAHTRSGIARTTAALGALGVVTGHSEVTGFSVAGFLVYKSVRKILGQNFFNSESSESNH